MKLYNLYESDDPFGDWVKSRVSKRIMRGESKLRNLLVNTEFNIDHIHHAILHGECLRNPEPGSKSLGPTYLEQTVSNVLRDLMKERQIPFGKFNDARSYFGLERLTPQKLKMTKRQRSKRKKR